MSSTASGHRVLLIGNPASGGGRGRSTLRRAATLLRELGVEVLLRESDRIGSFARHVQQHADEVDRVIACGGDGFLSEATASLADTDLPLAILPGGRGNDVVRCLGVPLDLRAACRLAVTGTPRAFDLGDVNGRTFATVATCGLDAEVSRRSRRLRLPFLGPATYFVHAIPALLAQRPFEARLEHDDGVFEGSLSLIAVANTATYGGGFRIAPMASTDDGLLDAIVVEARPSWQLATMAGALRTGRHLGRPGIHHLRSRHYRLETTPAMALEADGEPLASSPCTYRVRPEAVRVVTGEGRPLDPRHGESPGPK
ncbi:MAG: diacylglycerol kinase family protein [Acidobacteriota bacterium]